MFDFAKADNGTVIEGFLNDNQEAKILFILREPDCPDQQEFWFRMIHDDKRDANGKSYRGNKRNLKYPIIHFSCFRNSMHFDPGGVFRY